MEIKLCPCCSGKEYKLCCEPLITGAKIADTPVALMRSRYSAYTQANMAYIQQTMKPPATNNFNAVEAGKWAEATEWLGLEIVQHEVAENRGTVEFIATFILHDQKQQLHEVSQFRRDDGKWYYVAGLAPVSKPVRVQSTGRNEACPCGSGKKFKKCCG